MLSYIKAFLVFLGLLEKAVSGVEQEIEKSEMKGAQAHAEETGDTSRLDELLGR